MFTNCELTSSISFPFDQEEIKDDLMRRYESFRNEFENTEYGECGHLRVLLPQTIEAEGGAKLVISGTFEFDCILSIPHLESALSMMRRTLNGMDPRPAFRVTLRDNDSGTNVRLYPNSVFEFHLSNQ